MDPLQQQLQQAILKNQIAQPGTKPLERTSGAAYDLKYTPFQMTLANKMQMDSAGLEQVNQMAQQQWQQERKANPTGKIKAAGEIMDQLLLERLKAAVGGGQPTQ
jgi:hypothetical protein